MMRSLSPSPYISAVSMKVMPAVTEAREASRIVSTIQVMATHMSTSTRLTVTMPAAMLTTTASNTDILTCTVIIITSMVPWTTATHDLSPQSRTSSERRKLLLRRKKWPSGHSNS